MKKVKNLAYLLNTVIVLYLSIIVYFVIFGGFKIPVPGSTIVLNDLENPILILLTAAGLRFLLGAARNKNILFALITVTVSSAMVFGAGEWVLRNYFKDSYGYIPIGKNEKAKRKESERGPVLSGPKSPDKKRILIQGDSITWGQGLRNWTDLYPHRLLQKLNSETKRYEMTTMAIAGKETDWHAWNLAAFGNQIDPDIIVYQWYINDIEIKKNRTPALIPPWRKFKLHEELSSRSRLYSFIDHRLELLFTPPGKHYADYINDDFEEGGDYWQAFRDTFHQWATRANSLAERVIIVLYPVVPFKGEYPLKTITQRVAKLAKPHLYTFPAYKTPKTVGENVADKRSLTGVVRKAIEDKTQPGMLVFGPYTILGKGSHTVTFRLKSNFTEEGVVALIDVVCDLGEKTLSKKTVEADDFNDKNEWREFTLEFEVEKKLIEKVEFRVEYKGNGDLGVDTISLPVDYKLETVDLLPYLAGFDTHVSLFDAHPNARTHGVIADVLFETIATTRD